MYAPAIPAQLDTQQWPEQGHWTYEDYLRLPDDGRTYEIIFGTLYMNAAPIFDHQYTVGEIFFALQAHAKTHDLGMVLTAPFEVHLDSIARPVQPDILFIPKSKALQSGAKHLIGAPDLVVEVLSPSTRRRDTSVKVDAYERGGVREYWIVDLVQRSVIVYALPDDGGREYFEFGLFRAGETLKSHLFPDLQLPVESIFLPETK